MPGGGFNHGSIEANGITFHYVSEGSGPLVLMLHGFPESWYAWRHQLGHLSDRFRVVAPDMRGYGETEKPQGVASYRLPLLSADIKCLIEAFGEKSARVIGHDWGGVVAWAFAAAYPRHVDRLVIMNAPHPSVYARSLLRNPRQLMRSAYVFFFQLPSVPEAVLSARDFFVIRRLFTDWAIDKSAFTKADLDEFAAAAARPGALTAGLNYYRAAFRGGTLLRAAKRFPTITCPTLVIWAERDRALGKELTYGLGEYVSDVTVRYVPDCSHWVQQEQPRLVNRFLDEFL